MNNVKTIVFRVDAFVSIGVGHVMRCLTLTDILSCKGAECHFLTRNLDGNITSLFKSVGITCIFCRGLQVAVVKKNMTMSNGLGFRLTKISEIVGRFYFNCALSGA